VGSTLARAAGNSLPSAHPHGCGEHSARPRPEPIPGGSSPRVWGTLGECPGLGDEARLIPTGVGNTSPSRRSHEPNPAHPHGGGEHLGVVLNLREHRGSSSRVWGTLRPRRRFQAIRRLIPTGVGSTSSTRSAPPSTPAHPHGCGEHSRYDFAMSPTFGSSPRVWGAHGRRHSGRY